MDNDVPALRGNVIVFSSHREGKLTGGSANGNYGNLNSDPLPKVEPLAIIRLNVYSRNSVDHRRIEAKLAIELVLRLLNPAKDCAEVIVPSGICFIPGYASMDDHGSMCAHRASMAGVSGCNGMLTGCSRTVPFSWTLPIHSATYVIASCRRNNH